MRFLHTSDWHLGASEGSRSLSEDQQFFIDDICRIISEEDVDAVLVAGDIYDRSVPSAEAIRLYDDAMNKICIRLGKKALVIAGNHDSAERLSSCNTLLEKAGLYIAGSLGREAAVVPFDDSEVFLLPWITEEKVKSIFPEKKEEITDITAAYKIVTDHLRGSFTPGKRHLILAHAFITDSETSTSDRAAEIGFATQVSAKVFDGFDYVALGHIHKAQDINENIRYCGTPMPYSFGKEEKQEKSVTIIDTDTMNHKVIPLQLLHKRSTLSGTLEDLLENKCPDDIRNGYIRVRVSDTYIGLGVLAELRSVYPNLLDAEGRSYEGAGTTIALSLDEFEALESDPMEIFRHFCKEIMDEEPDEHLTELFRKAVADEEGLL